MDNFCQKRRNNGKIKNMPRTLQQGNPDSHYHFGTFEQSHALNLLKLARCCLRLESEGGVLVVTFNSYSYFCEAENVCVQGPCDFVYARVKPALQKKICLHVDVLLLLLLLLLGGWVHPRLVTGTFRSPIKVTSLAVERGFCFFPWQIEPAD